MLRDTTSKPKDSTFAPPSLAARGGGPWRVWLGGASLDLGVAHGGRVSLRLGSDDAGEHASGSASVADVRSWCRALAMLLDARLALRPADEVELRSPMLVAEGIGCLALWRWLGNTNSALRLLVAHSPEQLVEGDETAVLFVTVSEVHALTAALSAAAASADPTVA